MNVITHACSMGLKLIIARKGTPGRIICNESQPVEFNCYYTRMFRYQYQFLFGYPRCDCMMYFQKAIFLFIPIVYTWFISIEIIYSFNFVITCYLQQRGITIIWILSSNRSDVSQIWLCIKFKQRKHRPSLPHLKAIYFDAIWIDVCSFHFFQWLQIALGLHCLNNETNPSTFYFNVLFYDDEWSLCFT